MVQSNKDSDVTIILEQIRMRGSGLASLLLHLFEETKRRQEGMRTKM
ncbi:unnamed protein product [Ixodes pacificus]